MSIRILQGDCRQVLKTLPDNSVDSVVCDPPYELGFMGKSWDSTGVANDVETWRQCLRVLKPGGHLLAFAGTRTQHRMAVRIEDAGFEIRDMIAWVYGSGFPKSLDVSKAIDKAAGAEREVIGPGRWNHVKGDNETQADCLIRPGGKHMETAPATDAARQWQGWGTALKPALEPITVARKPLVGTVAANVLVHGTGALNIDGCRVDGGERPLIERAHQYRPENFNLPSGSVNAGTTTAGRWPANLIHDGSDEVAEVFGDPARFFYCAKASRSDRGAGNNHPTVKPTDLMRYLCRLVTPPGGTVLDPFMGSGSTLKAAELEGFSAIGIELDTTYIEIARRRIAADAPLFADLET